MVRMADLRDRDVVNVNDGRRIGIINDIDINFEKGTIKALIIPGSGGIMGVIGKKKDMIIPWQKVVKVGVDTILVDYPVEEDES